MGLLTPTMEELMAFEPLSLPPNPNIEAAKSLARLVRLAEEQAAAQRITNDLLRELLDRLPPASGT